MFNWINLHGGIVYVICYWCCCTRNCCCCVADSLVLGNMPNTSRYGLLDVAQCAVIFSLSAASPIKISHFVYQKFFLG